MGQNRIRGGGGGQKSSKIVGHHLCTFPKVKSRDVLIKGPMSRAHCGMKTIHDGS
jgi:hypothetical protein